MSKKKLNDINKLLCLQKLGNSISFLVFLTKIYILQIFSLPLLPKSIYIYILSPQFLVKLTKKYFSKKKKKKKQTSIRQTKKKKIKIKIKSNPQLLRIINWYNWAYRLCTHFECFIWNIETVLNGNSLRLKHWISLVMNLSLSLSLSV